MNGKHIPRHTHVKTIDDVWHGVQHTATMDLRHKISQECLKQKVMLLGKVLNKSDV